MKKPRSLIDFDSLKFFLSSISSDAPNFTFIGKNTDLLYHYTDLGGLSGIIQSKDIWLTNSRYSNDDDEITYGYRIVKEVIDHELNVFPDESRKSFLENLAKLIKEPASDGIYTCSFCLKDNLLSQWRGYGANGAGVSLAFNPFLFDSVLGIDSPKGLARLWKVFYDEEKQKNIIRKAIDFFAASPVPAEDKLTQASDAIQFFIPTFKHKGFEEEQECRLIFTPPPNCDTKPRFRVARSMLIPYYTLQDLVSPNPYSLPVTGVKIGPGVNRLLNMQSVRMLLNNNGFNHVNIESADIPYRG